MIVACIPAYNEENNIAKVIVEAQKYLDKVIVCDDGSEDLTGIIAERLGSIVIRHEQNLGKGIAVKSLFKKANEMDVDILVTIDADGQHDPHEIPKLISPITNKEADIVIGHRSHKPLGMTRTRRFAQKVLDRLAGLREKNTLIDSQSGFRAFSKNAFSNLETSEWSMGAETEILFQAKKIGLKIIQIPVKMKYMETKRQFRQNPIVQFTDVVSTIMKYYLLKRPIRLIGIPGSLMILFGLYGWITISSIYEATKEFALGHAIIYTTVFITGVFLCITSILLFSLKIMLQESHQ